MRKCGKGLGKEGAKYHRKEDKKKQEKKAH